MGWPCRIEGAKRLLTFDKGWVGTDYTFPEYVFWLLFGINFRAKVCEAGGRKWRKSCITAVSRIQSLLGRK